MRNTEGLLQTIKSSPYCTFSLFFITPHVSVLHTVCRKCFLVMCTYIGWLAVGNVTTAVALTFPELIQFSLRHPFNTRFTPENSHCVQFNIIIGFV